MEAGILKGKGFLQVFLELGVTLTVGILAAVVLPDAQISEAGLLKIFLEGGNEGLENLIGLRLAADFRSGKFGRQGFLIQLTQVCKIGVRLAEHLNVFINRLTVDAQQTANRAVAFPLGF